jgi:hypothetical protein
LSQKILKFGGINMKKTLLIITILSVVLSACGGGGGGGSSDSSPEPTTKSISGIWIGSFTSNIFHSTYGLIGIVTESGVARFAATSSLTQYSTVLKVSGNKFTSTATGYFPSGSYAGMGDIAGTFTPKGIINGTYSSTIDTGTFSLAYSSLYERPSSLSAIAGTWTNYSSGYYETITIDSSGNITRPPISGCTTSGSISIIDSNYNAYNITLNVNNCGSQNGLYSGLAVLTDTETNNDTLFASASTSTYSFVAELRRK